MRVEAFEKGEISRVCGSSRDAVYEFAGDAGVDALVVDVAVG